MDGISVGIEQPGATWLFGFICRGFIIVYDSMMLVFFRSGEISKSLVVCCCFFVTFKNCQGGRGMIQFDMHLFLKGIKKHQIVSYYPLLEGVCNRDVHWNGFSLFFLHA